MVSVRCYVFLKHTHYAMDRTRMLLKTLFVLACFSSVLKGVRLNEDLGYSQAIQTVEYAQQVEESCHTPCGDGCCPHKNGVCCEDGSGCCQPGQTCLSHIDTCIGVNSTTYGNYTLQSSKPTPVAGLSCPSGTTSCEGGCCPYPDAVCCNDGTCCPSGFKCSPDACVADGVPSQSVKKGLASKEPGKNMMGRKLRDLGIQICPDKLHLCPGSAECCRKDNGQWDCCPKVTNLKGECCNQLGFIWICCTDIVPKCYWWGCWFS